MTKYIFVTGGVVSSVGKGITVASIGRILKSRGVTVSVLKLDPYLNVDPGTMSPYQHGEVFVTKDGSETDLDLGHYERFIDVDLTRSSNITAGQIYSEVIARERKGEFLGGTIQTVPHVTDAIKKKITTHAAESKTDVIVIEVGGTVGDIEGLPFLEAIRQMRNDVGKNKVFYIHVTYLPYISATGELKTKPTQHSVRELRGIGIQPDSIICRSDYPVTDDIKAKIAVYCDVPRQGVIGLPTVSSVYQVPLILEDEGLGDQVVDTLSLSASGRDMSDWRSMVELIRAPKDPVQIAIVGKYVDLQDSYISVKESLLHAAIAHGRNLEVKWIRAEDVEENGPAQYLSAVSGIVVPGGFGPRGIEGMVQTVKYARTQKVPYLGLCLGMQVMVIEAGRSLLGLDHANSTEFDPKTADPVIDLMADQRTVTAMGGTMRLGLYPCKLVGDSIARRAYDQDLVYERHRHRFEFNNAYRERMEDAGLWPTGLSPDGKLVEIMEHAGHPFMLGVQFHPEFLSRPNRTHPLFREFIGVAKNTLREGGQLPLISEAAEPQPGKVKV
ncbi:MAG: CTP synthase [SAR202 cluster bacterium]|nr:CTP synthase [SAR202 cluster bacterium]